MAVVEAPLSLKVASEEAVGMQIDSSQEDLYTKLKTLQRQLEFLDIQVLFSTMWAGIWPASKAPVAGTFLPSVCHCLLPLIPRSPQPALATTMVQLNWRYRLVLANASLHESYRLSEDSISG